MPERKDLKAILAHRSVMTVCSDPLSQFSHRIRIVLAEKDVTVDVISIERADYPAELAEINPYASLPVLLDRDVTLFETRAMMEYIDERYPHPPLLPAYPVARAECRQYLYRIDRDWSSCAEVIENPRSSEKAVARARQQLRDELIAVAPLFALKPWFLSDEFSLADCCLAALFWRLPVLGVELPSSRALKPLTDYMQRLFARESFRASLSPQEKEMRRH